ncbi:MAG: hypothetical protein ACREPF_08595 [Rhodanobacteraceae bacterium]
MSLPAFFASLADLCRFRRGPEDMPYVPRLLVALLIGCGVLQVLFGWYHGARAAPLAAALLGGLAVVGVVFLLLRGRGRTERFMQTATALAAVYLVFGIVADALALLLPLDKLYERFVAHPAHPPTLTSGQALVALAVIALAIWQWCVWVRILRRALEVSIAGAVALLVLLALVNWIVAGIAVAIIGAA